MAFAVNGAEATPDALVATVIVVVLLREQTRGARSRRRERHVDAGHRIAARIPAPSPPARLAKAVLTVADCGVVPAFAVIEEAAPAVLVSEKLTVVSPVAAAVTV